MNTTWNLFLEFHEKIYRSDERRFGTGWENLFTEQFAFFLASDLVAATTMARKLLNQNDVEVVAVSTQVAFEQGQPDLRLDLRGGATLHIEHKFDSPLEATQLQRYLALGKVAMVSRRNQTVPLAVLLNKDYVRPQNGDFFRWQESLPAGQEAPAGFGQLREYFRSYMRELGLAPSSLKSEWRRLFLDRTDETNQRVQKDFGRMLQGVSLALRHRGFLSVTGVSHQGMMARGTAGSPWRHLVVEPRRVPAEYLDPEATAPFDPGYEALTVALVFDRSAEQEARGIYEGLPSAFTDPRGGVWYRVRPQTIAGNRIRLSLATPLAPILNNDHDLSERLSSSASAALDVLLKHPDPSDGRPPSPG